MKKIIKLTENDLSKIVTKIIEEQEGDDMSLYIRRRLERISQILGEIVDSPESETINFSDEFEYADNVLTWTIQKMMSEFDANVIEQNYDSIMDILKEIYGEHLLEIYQSESEPEDDYEDFEELD